VRVHVRGEARARLLEGIALVRISGTSSKGVDHIAKAVRQLPVGIRTRLAADPDALLSLRPPEEIPRPSDVEVAILAALEEPELSAVLNVASVECRWRSFSHEATRQDLHFAWVPRAHEERRVGVIALSARSMGLPSMAILATRTILVWAPRMLVLVGIAAGVKDRVRLGDIIVPDRVFVHDSGKTTHDAGGNRHLAPDRWTAVVRQDLLDDLHSVRDRALEAARETIHLRACGESTENEGPPIRVHVGPLASGNQVVDSETEVRRIASGDRKVLGIDMESYSALLAAQIVSIEQVGCLVVKAASDHAVHKDDGFRVPAAIASSEFAMQYVTRSRFLDQS